MKSIAPVVAAVVVIACAMAMAPQSSSREAGLAPVDRVATYEHLATAIIAIRDTEESLVRSMLGGSLTSARGHLLAAAEVSGAHRQRMLEAAATGITDLAREGDKRIQAVRQRLLQAGHHHHTDAETEEDYMFIDSRERKALLALAGEVAAMGSASADDIRGAAGRLSELAERAMKSE